MNKNDVKLAAERENRAYVAGPMTGLPDHNFPAFNEAADKLRKMGYHVENPADHGVVEGAGWEDYLRADLAKLTTCSHIYLLQGWSNSRGARLEVQVAKALGIHIWYGEYAEPVQNTDGLKMAAESALAAVQDVLELSYRRAVPVCCGEAHSSCCGEYHMSWSDDDSTIMGKLHPVERSLRHALDS